MMSPIFLIQENGVIDQFYEARLKPYLKVTKSGLVEAQYMNQGIGFSRAFLKAISDSQVISQGLFRAGSANPKLTFYVQPLPLPGIDEIIFESNGQEYRYRNEPEEWRRFTWPGDMALKLA